MWFVKLFSSAASSSWLPKLIGLIILVGLGYFGWSYLENMKKSVEATKDEVVQLRDQNTEIKKANQAIADDMAGVKTLTDTFNGKLTAIRSSQNSLATALSTPTYKADIATNVPKAQAELNKQFADYATQINGESNGK